MIARSDTTTVAGGVALLSAAVLVYTIARVSRIDNNLTASLPPPVHAAAVDLMSSSAGASVSLRPTAVPFVPCACSHPQAAAGWSDGMRMRCAIVEYSPVDGGAQPSRVSGGGGSAAAVRSGGRSLSPQQMDMDGMASVTRWLTEAQQAALLDELNGYPFQPYMSGELARSCQEFGQPFTFYVDRPTSATIPPLLARLARRLVEEAPHFLSRLPNHILVNRYEAGQGIHKHVDDHFYSDGIAGLSLGSGAALDFEHTSLANKFYSETEYGRNLSRKYRIYRGAEHVGTGPADGGGEWITPLLKCGTGYLPPGSLFILHREARYAYTHEVSRRLADAVQFATRNSRRKNSSAEDASSQHKSEAQAEFQLPQTELLPRRVVSMYVCSHTMYVFEYV